MNILKFFKKFKILKFHENFEILNFKKIFFLEFWNFMKTEIF